jgi:hypothetical protein
LKKYEKNSLGTLKYRWNDIQMDLRERDSDNVNWTEMQHT